MGLDALEIVLEVEKAFQVEITDEEGAKTLTLGMLTDVVMSKNTQFPREEVFLIIQKITSVTLGIPADKIKKDSRFVEDLGLE